jgi:PAS domain S-box-containing protein
MKKHQDRPVHAELRRRAEERLKRQRPEGGEQRKEVEQARLFHELQVHQIELEMQNEELRQAHAQVEALLAEKLRQARGQTETLLARYTDLYDSAPAGYMTLDRDGAFRLANLTAARLLGVERSQLVNRRFGLFIAESDRRAFSDFLQRVFASQAKECCEVTLPQEGSEPRVVRIEGTRSADGQECHAVVLEITDRKRAEEALREREITLRSITDSTQDAILMMDTQGLVTYSNPTAETILGYTQSELVGRNLHEILVPERYLEAHQKAFPEFQRTGRGNAVGKKLELQARCKDGREIPIELSLSAVQIKGGWYAVGILRDITEHKRLEGEFLQAQKMEAVGVLAGGVAHDFNNILTAIMGYNQMTLKNCDLPAQAQGWMEESLRAAERAASLTRQLLVFSRKQILVPKVFDLTVLMTDLSKMLQRLIGDDINLVVLPADSLWAVKADPGQIEQVILNLAVNARDAMPSGGKITLQTANVVLDKDHVDHHAEAKTGEFVMLAVSDTGVGMTAEVRARIFEPFFTTKDQGKGTGLGLATCFGIVKQSSGYIYVYSEVGHGTTFKVYLPRVGEAAEKIAAHEVAGPVPRGTETILLVEDEDMVRELASLVLTYFGYTILLAGNGVEALRVVTEHASEHIHMVITDVIMPQMGGRDLADRLRATYPDTKLLFTSGYSEEAIVRHGVLDPGIAFLQKPYTPSGLARKVREVLDA